MRRCTPVGKEPWSFLSDFEDSWNLNFSPEILLSSFRTALYHRAHDLWDDEMWRTSRPLPKFSSICRICARYWVYLQLFCWYLQHPFPLTFPLHFHWALSLYIIFRIQSIGRIGHSLMWYEFHWGRRIDRERSRWKKAGLSMPSPSLAQSRWAWIKAP